jgi:hypothetical protein
VNTIDTITRSLSRRVAAALGVALCAACSTTEPDPAGPTVSPVEVDQPGASASIELEDAVGAWTATCANAGLDGLCVTTRTVATRSACKPPLLDLEILPRSGEAEDTHDVLDGLIGDIDAFTRGPFAPAGVEARGNAVLAHFDARIERHIAAPLDSKARVEEWLYDGERLITGLASIKRLGSPEMNVRAAWRTALVYASTHDKIANAPGQHVDEAVCAARAELSDPVASLALQAAAWCVDQAERNQVDDPSVDRCRALVRDLRAARDAAVDGATTVRTRG